MTWGYGCANHVGKGAGIAVGDRPAQGMDLRGEHRVGRDHALDRLEAVFAGIGQVDDESIDESPGEAHADPAADNHLVGQRVGDRVIEDPVKVRQRHIDDDARYRGHALIVPVRSDGAAGMPG